MLLRGISDPGGPFFKVVWDMVNAWQGPGASFLWLGSSQVRCRILFPMNIVAQALAVGDMTDHWAFMRYLKGLSFVRFLPLGKINFPFQRINSVKYFDQALGLHLALLLCSVSKSVCPSLSGLPCSFLPFSFPTKSE